MNRLVFTGYNRPGYFRKVINSWTQVRRFSQWRPILFLEPSNVASEMIDIAQGAGVEVHRNERRLGVLHNPWVALEHGFRDADFVVLAEDDVVVSTDTLEYFTWAQSRFRDEKILAVCACNQSGHSLAVDEHRIERTRQFCPLVWGTWHDRWHDVLRDTWDHDYTSGTPKQPESGWDWNINLRVMGDWEVLRPIASRSIHIGRKMGTHTTLLSYPTSVSPTFSSDRPKKPFHC